MELAAVGAQEGDIQAGAHDPVWERRLAGAGAVEQVRVAHPLRDQVFDRSADEVGGRVAGQLGRLPVRVDDSSFEGRDDDAVGQSIEQVAVSE